jgi:hypothetical protein
VMALRLEVLLARELVESCVSQRGLAEAQSQAVCWVMYVVYSARNLAVDTPQGGRIGQRRQLLLEIGKFVQQSG